MYYFINVMYWVFMILSVSNNSKCNKRFLGKLGTFSGQWWIKVTFNPWCVCIWFHPFMSNFMHFMCVCTHAILIGFREHRQIWSSVFSNSSLHHTTEMGKMWAGSFHDFFESLWRFYHRARAPLPKKVHCRFLSVVKKRNTRGNTELFLLAVIQKKHWGCHRCFL